VGKQNQDQPFSEQVLVEGRRDASLSDLDRRVLQGLMSIANRHFIGQVSGPGST